MLFLDQTLDYLSIYLSYDKVIYLYIIIFDCFFINHGFSMKIGRGTSLTSWVIQKRSDVGQKDEGWGLQALIPGYLAHFTLKLIEA